MELHSGRDQKIRSIPSSMFEVYVWDFETDAFYQLCADEAHWATVDRDDDYEQPIEMAGACGEDVG